MTAQITAADSNTFAIKDFRLQSGTVMPVVTIAYKMLGKLSPDRDNAVLITHGNTSGPQMIDPGGSTGEGSWNEIVGPGKAVDTDRFFVICPNMLGSSYGSTNAASIDPKTGKQYGPRFGRRGCVSSWRAYSGRANYTPAIITYLISTYSSMP
jgi:homoserine O-acetyltransferase/O-succinyltransferase